MSETSLLGRDHTDPQQNQAVLDAASAIVDGATDAGRAEAEHGPAVAAEAIAAARSRRRLRDLTQPVHLTVVWAMYGETGRMVPRSEHPHGEDFVRAKVAQLDWLTDGLPGATWSIVACDDGCPDEPSSADLMADIAAREGYPATGHRGVSVIRLAEVLAGAGAISPAFDRLTSTDQSRKGGSILAALAATVDAAPAPSSSGRTGRRSSRTAPATSRTRSSSCSGTSCARCSSRPWPTCSTPRPVSRPSTRPRSARSCAR